VSLEAGETAVAAADTTDAADGSPLHLAGGDGMSDSLRELVDIQQQFKRQNLTMHEAELFYQDWKMRHERSRSFKQKQVTHSVYSVTGINYSSKAV